MDKRTQLIIGVALSVFVVLSVFGYTPVFSSNIQEEVVLVPINSPDEIQLLTAQGFRIIEQYDAYVLAYAPVNTINAVNLGGMTIPVEKIDYSLGFAAGKLSPESLEEYKITGDTVNPGLYVVQLIGPAKPEWIDFLKNSGVILAYIPNYGYLVKVSSPIQIPEVSFIRGIYEYQPEWKEGMGLSKKLSEILSGKDNSTKLRISVILDPTVSDPVAVAEDLANKYGIELEKHPGRIGSIIIDTHGALRYKFIGTIDVKNIPSLLQDPRVVIVDYAPEIKIFNSVAARVTRVYLARDEMLNGLKVNLTGAGQVVAIADTGLDTGDPNTVVPDFAGRVLTIYDAAGDGDPSDPDDSNLGGHGTHVAGSVAGSGVMSGSDPNNHKYDGSFAGMAPEAQIHFESIGSTGGLTGAGLNYDSITNMATRAYNDGARIWTNSWGSSSNSYDSSAQEVDQFMWDHKDFLILFAAGNSGPGANTVGSPGTAKDIITVGASENLDPNLAGNGLSEYGMADNPDQLAYFSSRGPTADNRIKPDIVAPGSGIVSVRATTVNDSNVGATWIIPIDSNGDGKFDYIAMQGTSMATPVAAGTMVLIRQYFTDYEGITPSAALLKATAIVGTDILPGYVFGGYDQGWGRLNIAGSLFPKPPMAFKYWDWQTVDNGGVWQQTINVVNSSVPLRIVLVWTDYPGSQNANPALVNDLDLVVIAPDGTEYHGNILDNTTATSIANTTDYDRLNPVEVVRVTTPKTGTWTIKVIGHNIAQDDPDGSGSLDQTFALTVRGGIGPQKPENTKLLRERFDGDGWTYDEGRIQLTPGEEKKFRIRLFNWGTSTQSYTLGYSSDTSDITVSLSQTSVTLDPGKYVEIIASVKAAPSLTPGLYTLRIYAKDSNGYAQALQFKVALMHPVPFPIERITRTQENLTAETTSSLAIDPTDGSLWVAYFRQETDRQGNSYTDARLGKGDNFDLIVAHSTDGGMTWTEYVALHDFDRYFDYNGNDEQIIDWFYWFPQMDVDDNGKIYVAFSTAESVYVVYGDENGFDNQKFDTGSVSSSLFGTTVKLVYPWASVATFGAGKAMVVYSYYDSSSSTRHLKYVYTTDGGQSWTGPDYIDSNSNLVEYAPYAISYGGQVLAFFVGRDSSTSNPLALYYYVFDGSSWSGPTEVYSGSGSVFYPSAFVDSNNRLWVAFYEATGNINGFGVPSWTLKVMYYDGSWHGPFDIDSSATDAYPPAISEFRGKIWIAYSEASNFGTNNPIYNDKWPFSAFALKVVAFDPATESIAETHYLMSGSLTNFHVDGDNEAHEGVYFSFTTTLDWLNSEVMATAYTGNSFTFAWPTPMNNTISNANWVAFGVEPMYPVDEVNVTMVSSGGSSIKQLTPDNNFWKTNVTGLSDGWYNYSVRIKAIGETLTSSLRTVKIDTTAPSYVGDLINGDPTDWGSGEDLVAPDSSQIIDGTLIWKDAEDSAFYNINVVKAKSDQDYLYMLIDPTNLDIIGTAPSLLLEIPIDSNNDGTYDYKVIVDLSQADVKNGAIHTANLIDLSTGKNIADPNTIFVASTSSQVIELQIPRSLIGSPEGSMRIGVLGYQTSGAGNTLAADDVVTDSGNDYTVFDITQLPMFSSAALAFLALLLGVLLARRR